MASLLNPYISFKGDARAAMEFYQSVLGGKLETHTFAEYGAPEGMDPNQVMHSSLATDQGYTIFASDLPPQMEHKPGNNITISISGDDADILRGYFAELSAGGTVSMPLEKQMWGDEFGAFTDKFGINWMVNIAGT